MNGVPNKGRVVKFGCEVVRRRSVKLFFSQGLRLFEAEEVVKGR